MHLPSHRKGMQKDSFPSMQEDSFHTMQRSFAVVWVRAIGKRLLLYRKNRQEAKQGARLDKIS
jgi:hypothetical protein